MKPDGTLNGDVRVLAYHLRLTSRAIYRSYPRWFRRFVRFAVHQVRRLR